MTSERTSLPSLLWPLLLLALLPGATGCASTGSAGGGGDKEEEKDEDEAKDLAKKVELARLELDLAKLEAEQEVAAAERELTQSKVEADKAHIERAGFAEIGRARELDEARLGLDQSRGRAEDAAAELAELESMYAAEEFATKTKELVITRSRRDLEHARRAVDIAERKLKETEGYDLIGKDRELEKDDLSAAKSVMEAEQALAKLRLEKKIAVAKAEQELAELQRKAEKLAKKNEKAKEKGEKTEKPESEAAKTEPPAKEGRP